MLKAKRSKTYASIADQLAQKCNASIGDDGHQAFDKTHGQLWDGTVFYSIGEMKRVRGVTPNSVLGRDYRPILVSLIDHWKEVHELRACFAAMGLAMLGSADEKHPVLGRLSEEQRAKVEKTLRVTRAFPHNWEVFNASLRIGRTVLYGEDPALALPHLEKLDVKYKESGYFDDSANSGDYNNYGLMTINFALRLAEFLPASHEVRQQIEAMFRPHAGRYFELLKVFIGPNGEGWLFGRSAGVLGQLQCLSFLEQLLSKDWFTKEEAAWARCACRLLVQYMQDVFWDDDQGWFSFRDDHRACYNYRETLPMTWDLWRYFLQLEHYARTDEETSREELKELPIRPMCREIITHQERNTAYVVWSDGNVKWQMPIMGGPTVMAGDSLPRPYLPGLFEWTTGPHPHPVLCPRLSKGDAHGWPAWWPESTELQRDGEHWRYVVKYPSLCGQHGETLDWPIKPTVEYRFGHGFFERIDHLQVSDHVQFDAIRLEVLQGAPHPKSRSYPVVFALKTEMQSNMLGLQMSEDHVASDPSYRNYFSHPEKRWVLSGEDVTLETGEYEIRTKLTW